MIYSVCGEVVHLEQALAVIECAGVGYACRTTAFTVSKLRIGEKQRLYTYMNVREDAVELFGFYEEAELNCFKMLITISGVGPKAAISILSELSPQAFALAVIGGDSKSITRAQGVGIKIAQRIVLELKDKLSKSRDSFGAGDVPDGGVCEPASNSCNEAFSALMVLGFTNQQATKALSGLDQTMTVQEMVKEGLKRLSGK